MIFSAESRTLLIILAIVVTSTNLLLLSILITKVRQWITLTTELIRALTPPTAPTDE